MERGVPQRSILGPLPFGIFVNDLPGRSINAQSASMLMTLHYITPACRDGAKLKDTLESALDGVASWVDNNGLKMNVKKTQVMFLGRRSRRKEVEHALLIHQGATLTAESKVKFLGVIPVVDKDLNWSQYVHQHKEEMLGWLGTAETNIP